MDDVQGKVLQELAKIMVYKKEMTNYEKLVSLFIHTDLLGHYDKDNWSICLYGISTDKKTLQFIRGAIDCITQKYKFIVLEPSLPISNINILDIDL